MDVIGGLLRIKRIREDSRERELREARRALDHATLVLEETQASQQQRDDQRRSRTDALYASVCSRVVVLQDLEDLRLDLEIMKGEALADARAVEEAAGRRQERRDAFVTATQAWRDASRASEKFADLAREQQILRLEQAERLAELELEDHPARRTLAESAVQEDTAS